MRYFSKYLFVLLTVLLLNVFIFPSDKESRDDWKKYYLSYKGDACFILYDLKKDKYYIYNEARTLKEFSPASTFKIFNSLTALEIGVVKDENEVIKWDGVDRGREALNKDHSMRSAIKVSAVWYYQEIAGRIGKVRMQHFIDTTQYGNKDIGDSVDDFWLKGKIRITPAQQIEFLKSLYKNELPFSQRSIDLVKDILINEKTGEYILRAKTGWSAGKGPDIGWWVGYIETKDNVYFFVNNMELLNEGDEDGRIDVAKKILSEMGLYR